MAISTTLFLGGADPSTAIASSFTLALANSGPKAIIQAAGEALLQLSSSDVDDQASDTGASSVYIAGYNDAGDFVSETLVLTAQTGKNTVKKYSTITALEVAAAGSTGTNEGNIYVAPAGQALTAGVPNANVIHVIGAGDGRARLNQLRIPRGYSASVVSAVCSAAGGNVTVIVQARANPTAPWLDVARFVATDANGSNVMPILNPKRFYGGEIRVGYEDAAGGKSMQVDVQVNLATI